MIAQVFTEANLPTRGSFVRFEGSNLTIGLDLARHIQRLFPGVGNDALRTTKRNGPGLLVGPLFDGGSYRGMQGIV